MSGKLDGHSYPVTPKNFQTTHIGYRAHRAVIFAIAQLSCFLSHGNTIYYSTRTRKPPQDYANLQGRENQ